MKQSVQDLQSFNLPPGFRGKSKFIVQLWWMVQGSLFAMSPQYFYGWRRMLLRLFGAKIGKKVLIRPTVKITYPWKLDIGDYCWVGDDVQLYTLDQISIGKHSVISQRSYLCAGSHDYTSPSFDIYSKPISVGSQCWIATDVFLHPGVSIDNGTVVGARSTVTKNLEGNSIYIGTPARLIKKRQIG